MLIRDAARVNPIERLKGLPSLGRLRGRTGEVWPRVWPAATILFIAFCIIAIFLAQGTQEANLVAAFGLTIAVVTALIQGKSDGEGPDQAQRSLSTIAIALPLAAVWALIASGAVWLYLSSGPLDVLDRVSVQQPDTGLPYGGMATVEVRAPHSRDRLKVVFRITDHDPIRQNCLPNGGTRLEVTLDQQGNRRTVHNELLPGRPLTVAFTTPPNAVRLRVRVTNTQDRSCVMDLSVSKAEYHEWPTWCYPAKWF